MVSLIVEIVFIRGFLVSISKQERLDVFIRFYLAFTKKCISIVPCLQELLNFSIQGAASMVFVGISPFLFLYVEEVEVWYNVSEFFRRSIRIGVHCGVQAHDSITTQDRCRVLALVGALTLLQAAVTCDTDLVYWFSFALLYAGSTVQCLLPSYFCVRGFSRLLLCKRHSLIFSCGLWRQCCG